MTSFQIPRASSKAPSKAPSSGGITVGGGFRGGGLNSTRLTVGPQRPCEDSLSAQHCPWVCVCGGVSQVREATPADSAPMPPQRRPHHWPAVRFRNHPNHSTYTEVEPSGHEKEGFVEAEQC